MGEAVLASSYFIPGLSAGTYNVLPSAGPVSHS